MRLFLIATGDQQWKQEATSIEEAVKLAFMRKPPKSPGELTRITAVLKDGHTCTTFLSTEQGLESAGYTIKKTGLTEGSKFKVRPA